jgi:hypothetical protein
MGTAYLQLKRGKCNYRKGSRSGQPMCAMWKVTHGIRTDFDAVVMAIGMRSAIAREETDGFFYAGDVSHGPTTVVEAVASGKNAALEIDAYLKEQEKPAIAKPTKSHFAMPGYNRLPVSLETDFFGRAIHSPYLLSASPLTDGFEQMNKAYEHGWAGGIMKTAFDNVPIHIPSEYMFTFNALTYGNSDNVSGIHWTAFAVKQNSS